MEFNNDLDVDSLLIQQFSSMATQDHEVLVAELHRFLGNQLSAEECAFFLDMNNWNLQAAICSFFEFQHDVSFPSSMPKMSLVADASSQEVQTLLPNMTFRKTWRISNPGHQTWPPGCCLRFVNGSRMTVLDHVVVDALEPASVKEVSLDFTSPAEAGSYSAEWRMSTRMGSFFGDSLPVAINVIDGNSEVFEGLVAQMSHGCKMEDDDGSQSLNSTNASELPKSLELQQTQTNATTCEPDADTMEML